MKLGSFFIICKPTFQVPNKSLERFFLFTSIFWGGGLEVQFISHTIVHYASYVYFVELESLTQK